MRGRSSKRPARSSVRAAHAPDARPSHAHAPLPPNHALITPGARAPEIHEREADRAAEVTANGSLIRPPLTETAGTAPTPPHALQVVGGSGTPLDGTTRALLQDRLGHDLSDVRIHADREAAVSARRVAARAYTVGNHIVFGAGRFAPGTDDGKRLLGHEIAHVLQQRAGMTGVQRQGDSPEEIRAQIAALEARAAEPISLPPQEASALVEQRNALLDQLAVATRARATGGAAGPPIPPVARPRGPSAPVAPEDMVQSVLTQRHFTAGEPTTIGGEAPYTPADFLPATRGSAAGTGFSTNAAIQIIDANGQQVAYEAAQYGGTGEAHAEAQALARLRLRLAGLRLAGGRMVVAVDQLACGGCLARLRAFAMEFGFTRFEVWVPRRGTAGPKWTARSAATAPAPSRSEPAGAPRLGQFRAVAEFAQGETLAPPAPPSGGTTPPPTAPPELAPPIETPPVAETATPPVTRPATTPTEPAVAPEAGSAPRSGAAPRTGGGWNLGSGIFGFALPLFAGYVHQGAVRQRIREQAAREGSVGYDAPSGEGLLYDLGAWLIDPARSAERAVGPADRVNVPVWRARIRRDTSALAPGQTYAIRWSIGVCRFDMFGEPVREERTIRYRKQPDGRWIVIEGDATDTIDVNRLISTDVSDAAILGEITADPCLA